MTRVGYAIELERSRIIKASVAAVDRVMAIFATGPEVDKALQIIWLAVQSGRINAKEGGQLTTYATRYSEASLAERIVLAQALAELGGLDVSAFRPPIFN